MTPKFAFFSTFSNADYSQTVHVDELKCRILNPQRLINIWCDFEAILRGSPKITILAMKRRGDPSLLFDFFQLYSWKTWSNSNFLYIIRVSAMSSIEQCHWNIFILHSWVARSDRSAWSKIFSNTHSTFEAILRKNRWCQLAEICIFELYDVERVSTAILKQIGDGRQNHDFRIFENFPDV